MKRIFAANNTIIIYQQMRKVLLFLTVASIVCASAVSCQPVEKYDTPDSVALYTKSGPAVDKTAGTKGVTITATAAWYVTTDASWVVISPADGEDMTVGSDGKLTGGRGIHEVILTYTENTTGAARTANVVFTTVNKNQVFGKQYSETYVLTQSGE